MRELEQCFCPNEQCKDHALRSQGNIAVRGKYGKDKSRDLLYCRTCGKRFASTQASALFGLHLSAETIRQIIYHAAEEVGVRATARLLITFWIGGRGMDDARRILKDLTVRSQGKPLFVSDELSHYGTVLGELFHKLVPPALTGKPGRPGNPERVIDADLDYATVHKTRQGAQVIKVERKVIHGSEKQVLARLEKSPSQTINTAYIERSNLDGGYGTRILRARLRPSPVRCAG